MGNWRNKWASSFEPPSELWRLEYDVAHDLAVFVSKPKITTGVNEDPLGRMPIYHVWKGDSWIYCGANMQDAYAAYERLLYDE